MDEKRNIYYHQKCACYYHQIIMTENVQYGFLWIITDFQLSYIHQKIFVSI